MTSVHEIVGGTEFFVRLVDDFYDRVAADEVLSAIYPDDLTEPRRTTAGFLSQYFGGPPHYSEERGHPRLRMRHAPFRIDQVARDRWLEHMLAALDTQAFAGEVPSEVVSFMRNYFEQGSTAMINTA